MTSITFTWIGSFMPPREEAITDAERGAAKHHLKNMGWTQQAAASELGVSFEHLNRVLNHWRESRRLLGKIMALPVAPKGPARNSKKGAK